MAKKVILVLGMLALLSAGCAKVELKQEIPSSPKESYEQLPR